MVKTTHKKRTPKTAKKTKGAALRAHLPGSEGISHSSVSLTSSPDSSNGFEAVSRETEKKNLETDSSPVGDKAMQEMEMQKETLHHRDEGTSDENKGYSEPSEVESSGEVVELLGFLLGREEYAIQIDQVKEIIRPVELTSIPRSSSVLLGIISLRGMIVPICNLKNKLVLLQPENRENGWEMAETLSRFVIFQTDRGILGLLVDGVTDVIKVKENDIKTSPPLLNKEGKELIRGITTFKDRIVILLQTNRAIEVIEKEIEAAGRF
ncbi:MAG: chemotaxis protein CheW [Nitrospiria bacterium]